MTKTARRPKVAQSDAPAVANTIFHNIPEQAAPLDQLAVAPENLRYGVAADDQVPQLGQTMFEAGQLDCLYVRPGRGKEAAFMVLDGRRRLFGFHHLASAGMVAADHPVRIKVLTDPAAQLAAVVLTNVERQPVHHADVLASIKKLKSKKMSVGDMGRALGYPAREIQGWLILADLHPDVLQAYREGEMTLRQAKLLTKVDANTQQEFAARAFNGYIYDSQIEQHIAGVTTTINDPRFRLVSLDAYAKAGGRIEQDLFGQTADRVLDADKLQALWLEHAKGVIEPLREAGLAIYTGKGLSAPEGFETYPWVRPAYDDDQSVAAAGAREAFEDLTNQVGLIEVLNGEADQLLRELVCAALAYKTAAWPGLTPGAVEFSPDAQCGLSLTFYALPNVDEPEDDEKDDDENEVEGAASRPEPRRYDVVEPKLEIDVTGLSNALIERQSDVATRGLIRALADDPVAALTLVVTRMFVSLGLEGAGDLTSSISTMTAKRYSRYGAESIEALDGEVFARVAEHRAAYLASGLRPLAWVAGLSHGEKAALMAELAALSLNGLEKDKLFLRRGARVEATELATMLDFDITAFWIPDVAYFGGHTKKLNLGFLEAMGAEVAVAATLKKDDLAVHVAEQAAERQWAPPRLSWKFPAAAEAAGEEAAEEAAAEGPVATDGESLAPETAEPGPALDEPELAAAA